MVVMLSQTPALGPITEQYHNERTESAESVAPHRCPPERGLPQRTEPLEGPQPILNNIKQYLSDKRALVDCAIFNNLSEPNPGKLNNCEPKPQVQPTPQPIFSNLLQNPIGISKIPAPDRPMPLRRASGPPQRSSTLAHLDGLDAKAMRYYRIWIYTCNAVLLLSVLVFTIVAGHILVVDYRRLLVPGLALYQPSFLYAYVAILAQSGALQLVGCLGALRLNERLLNIYWLMLLLLLLGDFVIGAYWTFRFEKICEQLQPALRHKLAVDYATDPDFTALWDRLQNEYKCCGVISSQDFTANRSLYHPSHSAPTSCCASEGERRPPIASAVVFRTEIHDNITDELQRGGTPRPRDCLVHAVGCEERLLIWLRQTADVLFVLGYCVIAFLKLCFLGILRYEIREMIQKIKVLQSEMTSGDGILAPEMSSSPNHINHQTQPHTILINASLNVNGGLHAHANSLGEPKFSNNRANRQSFGEGERESLLLPSIEADREMAAPFHVTGTARAYLSNDNLKQHQLQGKPIFHEPTHRHLYEGVPFDSDTNSSCALIVEDTSTLNAPALGQHAKNINGNNNYELHEFEAKNSYRLLTSSTATKI